jgi:predicted dehydrogenase
MKFQVGVIGATGFIGTPYRAEIREAADDASIVALCARRQDRLAAAAKEDGAALFTDDWRKVVEHPDVNLIVVATPDALHYEAVMACAELGKHVVCEKPVGSNAWQALEMWTAYRDKKLGHFVPFWTRYVPVFRRAREIAAAGTLGEIKAVIYRWHNPRPAAMPFTWRDDATLSAAGSIADVGSHAYDTVRWILGDEVKRVFAHADVITAAKPDIGKVDLAEALDWGQSHSAADASELRKGTAADYATIAWEFNGGVVGALMLSHAPHLRKGLAPELELHGSEASLALDRIRSTITISRSGEEAVQQEPIADPGFGNRFAKHVFPAIRQRTADAERTASDHPGLDDGWRVQVFTDAAARSAESGTWIELSSIDDAPID